MSKKIKVKDQRSITVTRYFTPKGEPTCASLFARKEGAVNAVCEFYRTQKLGCHETCLFAPGISAGLQARLRRRGIHESGYLIPGSFCMLFSKKELAKCTSV